MLERVDAALAVFGEEVRRGRAGSALPGIAPGNAHLCKEKPARASPALSVIPHNNHIEPIVGKPLSVSLDDIVR